MEPVTSRSLRDIAADSNGALLTREQADVERVLKEHEFDHYATSKSISQTMLNTTSIQAQIVILVSILA